MLGLLRGLSQAGVSVPGDLAVVGYDDIEFAANAAVPLTSVRQPKYQLGRAAAELLLDEADRPQSTSTAGSSSPLSSWSRPAAARARKP